MEHPFSDLISWQMLFASSTAPVPLYRKITQHSLSLAQQPYIRRQGPTRMVRVIHKKCSDTITASSFLSHKKGPLYMGFQDSLVQQMPKM